MSERDDDFDPEDLEAAVEGAPDGPLSAPDELAGRLVEPDQGIAGRDKERDPVASETTDDDGLSAEEAAMHVTDRP
jgi:hypothetical protein